MYVYTFNYFIERNFNENLNETKFQRYNIFNASPNIKEDISADISNFRENLRTRKGKKKKNNFGKRGGKKKNSNDELNVHAR